MPKAPVAMGQAARKILHAAAPFLLNAVSDIAGPDLVDRQTISFGPFRVTPYLVDHSAYDAYAVLIEADGKRLFYSGDFRAHGRKQGTMERLFRQPPRDIDVLLLEGTTLGRGSSKVPLSEAALETEFVRRFKTAPGLVMVGTSAQNIDRLVTIYRACKRTGRTLLIDLYAAEILKSTGNPAIPQSGSGQVALCIPQRQRVQIKNKGLFDELEAHSGHRVYLKRDVSRNLPGYVLLFRPLWMHDLETADCLSGACLIHSQWEGYLSDDKFGDVSNWVDAHGIGFVQLHTSGHASHDDLKRMAAALSPNTVVPIHTDVPHQYDQIYDRISHHADGEWWDV